MADKLSPEDKAKKLDLLKKKLELLKLQAQQQQQERPANPNNEIEFADVPTIAEMPIPGVFQNPDAMSFKQMLSAKFGPTLTDNPDTITDIYKNNLPGSTFSEDKFGNRLIEYKGQKYYYNKPGKFDAADLTRIVNPLNVGVGAATLGTGGTAGIPAGMIVGGLTAAGTSAGEDILAHQAAKDPNAVESFAQQTVDQVDPWKALISGGIGTVLPLAPAALKGTSTFVKNMVGLGDDISKLNPDVRNVLLRNLEIDNATPRSVTAMHPEQTLGETGPAMEGVAKGYFANPKGGIDEALGVLEQRNAGTNAAVNNTVNRTLGSEVSARDTLVKRIYKNKQDTMEPKYSKLWAKNNDPVDVRPVINDIDRMLSDAGDNTAEAKLLLKYRNMLVEKKAQPKIASKREPVTDPKTGKTIYYKDIPGQEATPETYVTNARVIHKIKNDLNDTLKFGFEDVKSGAIKNGAGKKVAQQLSDVLSDTVPGYKNLSQESAKYYKQADAVDLGYDLFDAGKDAVSPEALTEILNDEANANLKPYIAAGARARVENALGTKSNDLQAVKQVLADEGDWRRFGMNQLFGKDKVDELSREVVARQKMRDYYANNVKNSQTAQRTFGEQTVAEGAKGVQLFPDVQPSANLTGMAVRTGLSGAEKTTNFFRGLGKGDYYTDLGRSISMQGDVKNQFVKKLLENEWRRIGRNKLSSAGAPMVATGLLGAYNGQ